MTAARVHDGAVETEPFHGSRVARSFLAITIAGASLAFVAPDRASAVNSRLSIQAPASTPASGQDPAVGIHKRGLDGISKVGAGRVTYR